MVSATMIAMDPNWAWTWAIWIAVTAGTFGYLEARAIHDPKVGDTLSEVIRAWLHTRERGTRRGAFGRLGFLLSLVGFGVWFAIHILVPGFF